MSADVTFVLVGHCGPDCSMLRNAIRRAVPAAAIVEAEDESSLKPHLQPRSILLVNRQLAHGFATDSGVELIRQVSAGDTPPITMLISNIPQAQDDAARAGALPGFGKSHINDPSTHQKLRDAAARLGSSASGRAP